MKQSTNKLLSIIIPTYNMEKYLHRCLDSLINAKEVIPYIEILIINDGSKDKSSEIAHIYQKKYPESIIVVDKENGNYGSCVNAGLKLATGKYIKILDADDYFNTEVLNKYIFFLSTIDTDLVLCDYCKVNEHGTITDLFRFDVKPNVKLNFSDYCNKQTLQKLQMHAVTYRTEILKRMNYVQSEGISYTDQEWIFMPMNYMATFSYYASALYMYMVGRPGQTMAPPIITKNIRQFIKMVYALVDSYSSHQASNIQIKTYLDHKLCDNVKFVYNRCLLAKLIDMSVIDDFDRQLQKHKYVYELTENILVNEKFPYKFVRYYRLHHKKLPWFVNVVYKLHKKCQI